MFGMNIMHLADSPVNHQFDQIVTNNRSHDHRQNYAIHSNISWAGIFWYWRIDGRWWFAFNNSIDTRNDTRQYM